jgi:hypothetical protein
MKAFFLCLITSWSLACFNLGLAGGISTVVGWPKTHVAQGSLTDAAPMRDAAFKARPTDALFKYAGDGMGDQGQLSYPLFTDETIRQARATQQLPVMVVYTANMSYGVTFCDFANNDADVSQGHIPCNKTIDKNLDKHFASLALISKRLGENASGGSIVLNPDLLGMISLKKLQPQLSMMSIPVMHAAAVGLCVATNKNNLKLSYQKFGKGPLATHNFAAASVDEIFTWLLNNAYGGSDYWDTAHDAHFQKVVQQVFSSCERMADQSQVTTPSFTPDFNGWVQAQNWLIHHLGQKKVSFGWMENLWASGTANWLHQDLNAQAVNQAYSQTVVHLLSRYQIYSGQYLPDFLAFDKYERDAIPAAIDSWLYNQRDWHNYYTAIQQVSENIGVKKAWPVMLFQLPGGHLLSQQDSDPRVDHISTAADYLYGDALLGKQLSGVKDVSIPVLGGPYLQTVLGNQYHCQGQCTIRDYLTMREQDWRQPHLDVLSQAHIFAILWGGGTGPTTSVSAYPSDDGGWLWQKVHASS